MRTDTLDPPPLAAPSPDAARALFDVSLGDPARPELGALPWARVCGAGSVGELSEGWVMPRGWGGVSAGAVCLVYQAEPWWCGAALRAWLSSSLVVCWDHHVCTLHDHDRAGATRRVDSWRASRWPTEAPASLEHLALLGARLAALDDAPPDAETRASAQETLASIDRVVCALYQLSLDHRFLLQRWTWHHRHNP